MFRFDFHEFAANFMHPLLPTKETGYEKKKKKKGVKDKDTIGANIVLSFATITARVRTDIFNFYIDLSLFILYRSLLYRPFSTFLVLSLRC